MAEKEQKRWRAKKGETYYYVRMRIKRGSEDFHSVDHERYESGNYFPHEEAICECEDELNRVLRRCSGELHDFAWAVAEMKKGNKVIRASDKGRFGDFHCNVENCIYLKGGQFINDIDLDPTVFDLEQMEATDWEIYEGIIDQ